MSKRLTLAALAAVATIIAMPAASEAGHARAHAKAARPACALTAMLHRVPRTVAAVVHAPRVHVRRERPDWLKALFHRGDRGTVHKRRARR